MGLLIILKYDIYVFEGHHIFRVQRFVVESTFAFKSIKPNVWKLEINFFHICSGENKNSLFKGFSLYFCVVYLSQL